MLGIVASFTTLAPTVIWFRLVAGGFFQRGASAGASVTRDRAVPRASVARYPADSRESAERRTLPMSDLSTGGSL
jgi:hypothetical protein